MLSVSVWGHTVLALVSKCTPAATGTKARTQNFTFWIFLK